MEAASISRTSFPPMDRSHWLEGQGTRSRAEPTRSDLGGGWNIVQRIDDPDAKRANAQAQEDLANGASGLALVFEGAPNAFGYGLPAKPEAIAAALHGLQLNQIYLRIDVHPASRATVDWIVEIMRRKRVDPARMKLSFGIDPAAIMSSVGRLRMSLEALRASMPQSLVHFFAMGIPAVLLEADGRAIHNAGASEAQELAFLLSSAVSHLRLFETARQPLIYAIPHIGFALAVDQQLPMSVAKIEALRRLWRRVQEGCALPPAPARIHAETSMRMMTSGNLRTNIARNALAAFGAAAGRADSLSVLPHSLPVGLPNAEARAIARDAQGVLFEESQVRLMGEPSWLGEDHDLLTATLCEGAWDEFRRIEAEGGLLDRLSSGRFQTRIIEARDQRVAEALKRSQTRVDSESSGTTASAATLEAQRREIPRDGVEICRPIEMMRFEEMVARARAEADTAA
jgi:methylmalonyl-CoA mutase